MTVSVGEFYWIRHIYSSRVRVAQAVWERPYGDYLTNDRGRVMLLATGSSSLYSQYDVQVLGHIQKPGGICYT